jgi:hypothetical protein
MLFARLILALHAAVMAGLGLAYWVRPYEMANMNGMLLMETDSVSNLRVYFGGLQLGLAVFLIWSMRRPERARSALVLLVLLQLALSIARLGALWLDGGALESLDVTSLVYKLAGAALAALALVVLRRSPAPAQAAAEAPSGEADSPEPLRRGRHDPAAEPSADESVQQPQH